MGLKAMKISAKVGSLGFYAFIPALGFFAFSMLAWRGFYIIDENNLGYWVSFLYLTEGAVIEKYYWCNYVLLASTIASLVIAIASVIIYVYSEAKVTEQKNE
jgi:hypothetical protein